MNNNELAADDILRKINAATDDAVHRIMCAEYDAIESIKKRTELDEFDGLDDLDDLDASEESKPDPRAYRKKLTKRHKDSLIVLVLFISFTIALVYYALGTKTVSDLTLSLISEPQKVIILPDIKKSASSTFMPVTADKKK